MKIDQKAKVWKYAVGSVEKYALKIILNIWNIKKVKQTTKQRKNGYKSQPTCEPIKWKDGRKDLEQEVE